MAERPANSCLRTPRFCRCSDLVAGWKFYRFWTLYRDGESYLPARHEDSPVLQIAWFGWDVQRSLITGWPLRRCIFEQYEKPNALRLQYCNMVGVGTRKF